MKKLNFSVHYVYRQNKTFHFYLFYAIKLISGPQITCKCKYKQIHMHAWHLRLSIFIIMSLAEVHCTGINTHDHRRSAKTTEVYWAISTQEQKVKKKWKCWECKSYLSISAHGKDKQQQ